jgi:hypothetical protein
MLELLSNRIESNPGAVRFGRIESDQKKFDSTRIKTNSTRLDSIRCNNASLFKYSLVLIETRLEFC